MTGSPPAVSTKGVPARISVIGAGSLGLVLAAALARTGNLVTILARPKSAEALLDSEQIEVSGQLAFRVAAATLPPRPGQVAVTERAVELPPADVVLFTTKGPDLPASINEVAGNRPGQPREGAFVAGLQNGVVKDELLARAFGRSGVVGAATVLGSRRLSAGRVTVSGLGTTFFGEFEQVAPARTTTIAAKFVDAGLPCAVVADVRSLLWTKFCNAIGIFGVSAITGLPSVEIFARRPLALAYRSLLEEAAAVAGAEGTHIGDFPDLPIRTYLGPPPEVAAAEMASRVGPRGDGPPGFSSMAQDLAAGRPTEIEETFGDLLRRAHAHGLELPRSELVYRLVVGLEADRESARKPDGTSDRGSARGSETMKREAREEGT
jgi:2-dehydropantoate 2-reductase